MVPVTLSRKNQIVVPREALDVKAGGKLMVVVRGDVVMVLQYPKSHQEAISGLARGR
jgi:bifunctional DNA-binding transcriptional regulator/antitoxin component of YhaV-PrlF toxin-antitoxin module